MGRATKEIMDGLNIYYTENGSIFLVQDNYCHSLKLIKETLDYAKTIGLTVPNDDDVKINVLAGERYKGVMSIEFNSETKPSKGHLLTPDSGLWNWLKY